MEDRVTKRIKKTKALIVNTAMDLFKSYGMQNVTMEQIARECDIAKGTLYKYYSCKEAIIGGYMQKKFSNSDFTDIFSYVDTTKQRLHVVLKTICESINENQEIFEKFLIYQMQNLVSFDEQKSTQSGFRNIGEYIVQKGIENEEIREDISPVVLAEFFEFIFIELIKKQYRVGKLENSDFERYIDLFINGVKSYE